MNILVTGGAGFIGSHLTDALIAKGHHVTVVDNLSTGKKDNIHAKARFIKYDITHDKLGSVFQKARPEIVYHLAAQLDPRASLQNPVSDAKSNVLGTVNVLECSRLHKVKKFVLASTAAVYGSTPPIPTAEDTECKPHTQYGVSKLASEQYCQMYERMYGLRSVLFRMSNVYGPRQNHLGEAGVVAIFTHRLLAGKPCRINGNGKQTRDFVQVTDVVNAFVLALDHGLFGTYNVSTGKQTSVNELYRVLAELIGTYRKPSYSIAKKGEVKRSSLDSTRLKGALSGLRWQPRITLNEGLRLTVDYFRSL